MSRVICSKCGRLGVRVDSHVILDPHQLEASALAELVEDDPRILRNGAGFTLTADSVESLQVLCRRVAGVPEAHREMALCRNHEWIEDVTLVDPTVTELPPLAEADEGFHVGETIVTEDGSRLRVEGVVRMPELVSLWQDACHKAKADPKTGKVLDACGRPDEKLIDTPATDPNVPKGWDHV